MRAQLIAKPGSGRTGTAHYVAEMVASLTDAGVDVDLRYPAPPLPGPALALLKRGGLDLAAFLGSYPLRVQTSAADIVHLTSQGLATLLITQRFGCPVVVTVLDIIPYLVRADPALNTLGHPVDRLAYRLALHGLRRASALIAISHFTKQTLIDALHIPAERIQVAYPTIDPERFRPRAVPAAFRARYGLPATGRSILYVGSDDPRKNLRSLLRALAQVRRRIPDVHLVKVGAPHFRAERERLLALVAELGLQAAVHFCDDVPDDDLPLFYNAADVFAFPSLYEGFGLPVLEAMACGRPVVAAATTSLPEIVGAAGLLVEPTVEDHLTSQLVRLLQDAALRAHLGRQGLERSRLFSRAAQARATLAVYTASITGAVRQEVEGSMPC